MQNPLYWKKKTAIRWKLGSVECKVKYLVSDSFEVDQIYHDLKFSPLQSNQIYLTAVRTILVTHAFSATILVHIAEKLWWWLFVWNQWHKGKKSAWGAVVIRNTRSPRVPCCSCTALISQTFKRLYNAVDHFIGSVDFWIWWSLVTPLWPVEKAKARLKTTAKTKALIVRLMSENIIKIENIIVKRCHLNSQINKAKNWS